MCGQGEGGEGREERIDLDRAVLCITHLFLLSVRATHLSSTPTHP